MPEFLDPFLKTFLDRAFTMPTTVWSVLLILVILYWGLSLLAGLDLGGLDEAMDAAEGLDGAVDAMDAADGMDGALDAAGGLDGGPEVGGRPGLLERIGFGELPRVFTWTLVVIFGWTISYFGVPWLQTATTWALRGLGAILLLGIVTLSLAVVAAAVAIQPLRKLATIPEGAHRAELVGRTCVVKTTRVDATFGQAELASGQLVQARADDPDAAGALRYGTTAKIVGYDPSREIFLVEPLQAAVSGLSNPSPENP